MIFGATYPLSRGQAHTHCVTGLVVECCCLVICDIGHTSFNCRLLACYLKSLSGMALWNLYIVHCKNDIGFIENGLHCSEVFISWQVEENMTKHKIKFGLRSPIYSKPMLPIWKTNCPPKYNNWLGYTWRQQLSIIICSYLHWVFYTTMEKLWPTLCRIALILSHWMVFQHELPIQVLPQHLKRI